MAELRYNPLTKDWVMIASHRQDRPQMPKDWCPFCPGSGKVPPDYDVYKYDNDFPALSQAPSEPDPVATELYKTADAYGKCEVILYSPEHNGKLYELSDAHMRKLVELWVERFEALREDTRIKYIYIFENRGEEVGVTMPHPHGQIYGFPFIPKKLELELSSCKEHYAKHGECLLCAMERDELAFGRRVVIENEDFSAFIPCFSEYPYGLYVVSKAHKGCISDFNSRERDNIGKLIKAIVGTYDALFDRAFPYLMCMHNAPVNSSDTSEFYHFHIEFFPPMRSRDKIKFNASSETGAWAHCNPTAPEEKAEELRAAYERYLGAAGC